MKVKFCFISVILLFVCTAGSQANDPYRLSHKVEPLYQFIHLNLDPDKDSYSGKTKIEIEIREPNSSFRLHGKDFEISKFSLVQNSTLIKCTYNFEKYGLLRITASEPLTPGNYMIEFEFKGDFSKKGEGIVKFTKDSLNYIYTQMEDTYARQFFPCFDEPNFKFPYQIEITTPKHFLTVSNTNEAKITGNDQLKTVLFKKTKPIPSYLIAFAVGPYETIPIPGLSVPGRIILPKGYIGKSRYGKQITSKILNSLEAYFGIPYPYEKLDLIGVANYNFGAMENPGLVVFQEKYLIDLEHLALSSKYDIANVITHELAHMWFGDLVTMNWWNDAWLNEGFATWLADEIILKNFPELNSMDELYGNFTRSVSDDQVESIKPIVREIKGKDNPLEVFDALSYSKSQVVLRMLQNWMGIDNFRLGLKNYFHKYKWSNSVSDDLFNSMSSVTDLPVKQLMHDFIMQPGVPLVSLQVSGNKIILSQERFKTVEAKTNFKTKWLIPLNLKISDGEKIYKKQIVLDQSEKEFTFPDLKTIQWLHLKNNVTGYYLTLLPSDIMKAALSSGQLTGTEVQEIFIGWQYGWQAGKTNPVDILGTAFQFRNNQNKNFIEGFAGRIFNIRDIMSLTIPMKLFNTYMDQTAVPMLENLGLEIDLSMTAAEKTAQNNLIYSLENNSTVVNKISVLARTYYTTHPLTEIYFPYLRTFFYNEGNEQLYDSVRKRLETTKDPSEKNVLIMSLGYFPDRFNQFNLDYVLLGNLQSIENLLIPFWMHSKYRMEKLNGIKNASPPILEWIKAHEKFYRKKVSDDLFDSVLPLFVWDRDDLEIFNRLFPEDSRPKITDIRLQTRIALVERSEKLNQMYGDAIKHYLENFSNSLQPTSDMN